MDFESQIISVGYSGQSESEVRPYIRFRNIEDNEIKKLFLEDYFFNYNLSKQKICPGLKGEPCPFNNTLEKTESLCGYCESELGFKSAFFYRNVTNKEMEERMRQEHYVYLAYFAPNVIKVGTLISTRKFVRIAEQDCEFAILIAMGSGEDALNLERYISKTFDITESVRSNHKYKFLTFNLDTNLTREKLTESYELIKKECGDYSKLIIDPIEVNYIDKGIFYKPNLDKKWVDLKFKNNILSGEFKGIRGNYLILEKENILYFHNTKHLVGREFCTEDGLEYAANPQLTLF